MVESNYAADPDTSKTTKELYDLQLPHKGVYNFKLESLHVSKAAYLNASWEFYVHIKLNCNYVPLETPGSQEYKIEPPARLSIAPFVSVNIIHYWMRTTKEFPLAGYFSNPHPDCCPGPVTVTLK